MVAKATKKKVTFSTAPCTTPFSMIMGDDSVFSSAILRIRLLTKFLAVSSLFFLCKSVKLISIVFLERQCLSEHCSSKLIVFFSRRC
jgi:hypothetical protein